MRIRTPHQPLFLVLVIFIFGNVYVSFAQPPRRLGPWGQPNTPRTRDSIEREKRLSRQRIQDIVNDNTRRSNSRGRSYSRTRRFKRNKIVEKRLRVNAKTIESYSEYLEKGDWFTFKLLQPSTCGMHTDIGPDCFGKNGMSLFWAAGFSLQENDNMGERFAAFSLKNFLTVNQKRTPYFDASGSLFLTLMTKLRGVELEDVSLGSESVRAFQKYQAPLDFDSAISQLDTVQRGVYLRADPNGRAFPVSKKARVEKNGVYLVRSIAYKITGVLDQHPGRDEIVVFRVVDRDEIGDLTIVARRLISKTAPTFPLKGFTLELEGQ